MIKKLPLLNKITLLIFHTLLQIIFAYLSSPFVNPLPNSALVWYIRKSDADVLTNQIFWRCLREACNSKVGWQVVNIKLANLIISQNSEWHWISLVWLPFCQPLSWKTYIRNLFYFIIYNAQSNTYYKAPIALLRRNFIIFFSWYFGQHDQFLTCNSVFDFEEGYPSKFASYNIGWLWELPWHRKAKPSSWLMCNIEPKRICLSSELKTIQFVLSIGIPKKKL